MSLLADYARLCAAQHAISDARNLPERFKAVIDYQAELHTFCADHPEVIRAGVEQATRREQYAIEVQA